MPVLRVRDEDGNIVEIPAIKGDKGDPGVIVCSYVGDGAGGSRYFDIGDARSVLLLYTDVDLTVKGGMLTKDNKINDAWLSFNTSSPYGENILGVTRSMNTEGTTYHYIAFTSKGVAS